MKKISFILLISLFLMACSADKPSETENKSEETASTTEEESGIEVDKGLLNVEITLPKAFFEEDELEEIEKAMEEERNANITSNENDEIVVKMSKKDHKDMMKEMKEEYINTIESIIEDDEYPSIKDVSYNQDFTELEVKVDREGFENSLDGMSVFTIGYTGLFYQIFAGNDIEKEKITVKIVDKDTDEVFDESVYPDVLKDIGEELDEDME